MIRIAGRDTPCSTYASSTTRDFDLPWLVVRRTVIPGEPQDSGGIAAVGISRLAVMLTRSNPRRVSRRNIEYARLMYTTGRPYGFGRNLGTPTDPLESRVATGTLSMNHNALTELSGSRRTRPYTPSQVLRTIYLHNPPLHNGTMYNGTFSNRPDPVSTVT